MTHDPVTPSMPSAPGALSSASATAVAPAPDEELVRSGDAARALGLTLSTLNVRVLAGDIRGRRICGRLYIERAEIERAKPLEAERRRRWLVGRRLARRTAAPTP